MEAATLLGVSVTFLSQLLDTGELASHGYAIWQQALAVAQEAGAYDWPSTMAEQPG